MTQVHFTLNSEEVQSIIEHCLCQVVLGRLILPVSRVLNFCALYI